MGQNESIHLDEATAAQLRHWMQGPATSPRLMRRSQIVLLLASGLSKSATAARMHVSRRTVSIWDQRFRADGAEALRHDRPGRGRPKGRSASAVASIREAMASPPVGRKRWTSRALAKHVGVSHSTVLRVWRDANP